MRGKRSKQYRKLMQQYQLNFNFREPYQVLIDAQIIKDAARFKMRLGGMLENTLHGDIKPMITQCCIRHLYNQPASPDKDAWIEVAKQAERRRCGHHELDEPLSTLDCLRTVVDPKATGNNKHRYVVASQDEDVRRKMRAIVGVPLVYIARSVMILEPMANVTEDVREREEKAKIRAGLKGRRSVGTISGEKRKREDGDEEAQDEEESNDGGAAGVKQADIGSASKRRKIKGPKGPNPLAVKKPKKEATKPVQKQADNERSSLRRAAKRDSQAAEKAGLVDSSEHHDTSEASKKRKRKRKPKDSSECGGVALGAVDADDQD